MSTSPASDLITRIDAVDRALQRLGGARDRTMRRFCALAAATPRTASLDADALAQSIRSTMDALRPVRSMSTLRPVYAGVCVGQDLAPERLAAFDAALRPVLGGARAQGALVLAAGAPAEADPAALAQQAARIKPVARAPWWSADSGRSGALVASMVLAGGDPAARLDQARVALESAGAPRSSLSLAARRLACAPVAPIPAATLWTELIAARRDKAIWRGLRPLGLLDLAIAVDAPATDVVAALTDAREAGLALRPRMSSMAAPALITGVAARNMTGRSDFGVQAAIAMEAVHAATVAVIVATTAAVGATASVS